MIVNIDSLRSAQLVNREQFYVSISRARFDAQVYTDDVTAMRRAILREHQKEIAVDAVQVQQRQQTQAPIQQQTASMGMRI